MGRSRLLVFAFICIVTTAVAQQDFNFRQADSITYNATLAGNWDDVIATGKTALERDIDYFYLRLRLGMAYYQKNNYRTAIKHLETAERFNPKNEINKNYLYHSYLYSGRFAEAAYMAGSMEPRMREVGGIQKPGILCALSIESGPEFSNNYENNALGELKPRQFSQFQDLYGNSYYTNLGALFQAHSRVSIFASYSNLIIDKKTQFQYNWNSPDSLVEYEWGFARYFPSQPKTETSEYAYTLRQNSGYLKAGIYLGKGWMLNPAVHYIHVNTKSTGVKNNSFLVQDTAFYIQAIDSVSLFSYEKLNFKLESSDLILNNVVVSIGLNKQLGIFDLGIFGSWSNLNEKNQLQYGASLAYYPLGNLNLYGNTCLKGLSEDGETQAIFSQLIGGSITKFLWAEAFGAFGNLRGTNESNAYVVYNISDDISLKAGLNLIFVVSPSVSLSVRYQYLKKNGYRWLYGAGLGQGGRQEELDYTNQSIIGGLKWTF